MSKTNIATVKVTWGKEVFELTVDLQSTLKELKEELKKLTQVPIERQKILGIKPSALNDGATLSDIGVVDGKALMFFGVPLADVNLTAAQPQSAANSATATSIASTAATAPLPVGLSNVGNTCYMNAALQMLRLVPEARELLHTGQQIPLLRALDQLYKMMDTSKDAVMPLVFWKALITQNPFFGELDERHRPMQHDAQEALSTILKELTKNCNKEQSVLFTGMLKETTSCKDDPEDTRIAAELPFLILSCNINAEVELLEAGLEAALNETVIIMSEKLGREVPYSRTRRISVLPEYLFVHFVRFSWRDDTKTKAKILKPVSFPAVLDMFSFCTDELKESLRPEREVVLAQRDAEVRRRRELRQKTRLVTEDNEAVAPTPAPTDSDATTAESKLTKVAVGNTSAYYELCGVISHKGRTAESGHYVFWGKNNAQWVVYDDENVAVVKEEDVMRLRGVGEAHIAYVLMYRSRDPETKKNIIPL